jgi:hypothetical protein
VSGAAWQTAVDGRLIARCEAHLARGRRLARDWSVATKLRAPKTHLDPADWRAGFLRAERERDIPTELQSDLRENLPQALLRDLYRPVHEVGFVERELVEGTADRGGFAAMREARAARRVAPLPRVESLTRAVREYQAWRRALVAERWQPYRRDDEREPLK